MMDHCLPILYSTAREKSDILSDETYALPLTPEAKLAQTFGSQNPAKISSFAADLLEFSQPRQQKSRGRILYP